MDNGAFLFMAVIVLPPPLLALALVAFGTVVVGSLIAMLLGRIAAGRRRGQEVGARESATNLVALFTSKAEKP
ncbi:hypothetical protein [Microbacterium sp.]|uniref:hypothetical protein n=1 Tax=Microbacterium sp. TaxID=51671 RepID=UPI002FE3B720